MAQMKILYAIYMSIPVNLDISKMIWRGYLEIYWNGNMVIVT